MRLLPIALGLPGTIGFPTAIAHHRSPHGQVTEVSYAGKNIIVYHPSHGNSAPTSRMDCFVDSLLDRSTEDCSLRALHEKVLGNADDRPLPAKRSVARHGVARGS